MDTARLSLELKWLKANPHFSERPASITEFLGPDYLNIADRMRPAIVKELEVIMGEKVQGHRMTVYPFAIFSGAIGVGKTTIASIVLTYLAHWVLCLKDPQAYFNLLPGSRIAFMMMSTSEKQALEVVFGDVKSRVQHSPWFQAKYPFDTAFKNQLRFSKDIWIIPGDSAETTFEGYNILGGILDEADSHKQTKDKDYAELGYQTISSRITSRFEDKGFLMVIGQMKRALEINTPVLTPAGWVPIGTIEAGDQVIGSDGFPTKVMYVDRQGVKPLYRVQTTDGLSVRCCEDHLWGVYNVHQKSRAIRSGQVPIMRVCSTRELLQAGLTTLQRGGQLKWQIPFIQEPVQFDVGANLPISPYVLGVLLGDGSIVSGSVQFSSADTEIVQRVSRELPAATIKQTGLYGYRISYPTVQDTSTGRMISANPIIYWLRKLGVWGHYAVSKRIPTEYLLASPNARLELLHGLMDTDGSQDAFQNATRFVSISQGLAGDVAELVRSLGGKAVLHKPVQPTYSHAGEKRYGQLAHTVAITMPVCPFWLTRKAQSWKPRTANPMVRSIKSIEPDGEGEAVCIAIENEDGLFVTQDYLLTHNSTGFAAKIYNEFRRRSDSHAVRMTIWESFGWQHYMKDGKRDSFFYDTERHEIVPTGIMKELGKTLPSNIIEIPNAYRRDFENNPSKALRDLAGIPPASGSPFIELIYKITEARSRWVARHGEDPPVDEHGKIADWFQCRESLKRVCHIDIAFSAEGDSLGLAMGHVLEIVEINGEKKPYIVIDFLCRMAAPPGREIFLGDVRNLIYRLRDERKFKINMVTVDSFQSTDTRQQFERQRIRCETVSVDKQVLPYMDLREALYENRIEFPPYMVRLRPDDMELTEITVKELTELVDNGNKIDHPSSGSKDLSDCIAAICFTLMGDRSFHRKVVSMESHGQQSAVGYSGNGSRFTSHPAIQPGFGLRAPSPPDNSWRPPKR